MSTQIVYNWNCKHLDHIIKLYIRSLNIKGRANKGEDFKGVGCWNGKDLHFQWIIRSSNQENHIENKLGTFKCIVFY